MAKRTVKVCLLGDGSVGKTSLIRKFVMDKFDDEYIMTIGTKITKKEVAVESDEITLMIWDILGQKDYNRLQGKSFLGSKGSILVIDRTRRETYDSITEYWLPRLVEVVPDGSLVLAANKNDLVDSFEVSDEDLAQLAEKLGAPLVLTSAKTGENVEKMFFELARGVASGKETSSKVAVERGINNLVESCDAIIDDFCTGLKDQDTAMPYVRQQSAKAGLDIMHPSRESLSKFVDLLSEVDKLFISEADVASNRLKRKAFIKKGEDGP